MRVFDNSFYTAYQRLDFRYMDSTMRFKLISKIASFWLSSVSTQPDLCRTWWKTGLNLKASGHFKGYNDNLNVGPGQKKTY